MDVPDGESKVWCYKEQYCIGTWNVKSMNQDKLEVAEKEVARVNIDILGINDLKWRGIGEFTLDDHCIYYCEQKSLWRNVVVLTVKKRIQNAVLGCNLKSDRMISAHFQDKPFSIRVYAPNSNVIEVYAPKTNIEKADVNWLYEDL